PVVSDFDLSFETFPLAGRSQMLSYTAEPGFALAVRPPRLLARWAATSDDFGAGRLDCYLVRG
ncbi:MAG TPA: hypothetical protein VFO20_02030, partial [Propionibacteriaceae bacterium]|nr:hypothetical protein [Propionibacteriaceae bacterium]